MYKRICEAAEYIVKKAGKAPDAALVLGTAFDEYEKRLKRIRCVLDYREIPGFPQSENMIHAGKLAVADINGKTIAVLIGRYHCYEGYSAAETVIPLRALKVAGIRSAILTNAAGGINETFKRGDIMVINDHINLTPLNALSGPNISELGIRYCDMTYGYDKGLRRELADTAASLGIELKNGIYAYMPGPSYETPAEIQALKRLGADAVGMSTVHETVAMNHAGVKVLGLSCISNLAAGVSENILTEEEVFATLRTVKIYIFRLINEFLPKLP